MKYTSIVSEPEEYTYWQVIREAAGSEQNEQNGNPE